MSLPKEFFLILKRNGIRSAFREAFREISFRFLWVYIYPWSTLKRIASSKLVKSSIIWLTVTPVAAKALSFAGEVIDLSAVAGGLIFRLSLPFSWIALFFSAFFFLIGRVIFLRSCPEIVANYENASEAWEKGLTARWVIATFCDGLTVRNTATFDQVHLESLYRLCFDEKFDDQSPDDQRHASIKIISRLSDDAFYNRFDEFDEKFIDSKSYYSELFNLCASIADYEQGRHARLLCQLMFILGSIPLAIIVVQSVLFVIQAI